MLKSHKQRGMHLEQLTLCVAAGAVALKSYTLLYYTLYKYFEATVLPSNINVKESAKALTLPC